jgi:tRNA pseudouridine38-40 synthase
MNRRFFIKLSYKGSRYHGWQIQDNANSVQEEVQIAFSTILQENIEITGAGRTDAGVHASYMVAHCDSSHSLEDELLWGKLNRFLPGDISIHWIKTMHSDAHARFDAVSRTYTYLITRDKNPFLKELSHYVFGEINIEKMNLAADFLKKYNDFTSFSKLHSNNKTNLCHILNARWTAYDPYLVFTISADRFLRNMVRSITACMLDIGREIIPPERIKEIIEAKDRQLATKTAPAEGLFLSEILYPESYHLPSGKNDVFRVFF